MFFFQAEDGIRDIGVTGVQTCALPILPLVVLGQLSFILTIATLIIAARLRKFDRSLEEAAFDLGASRARVLRTVTLPFLSPALIGAGLVALLMSFENFNTTLMLVGSEEIGRASCRERV